MIDGEKIIFNAFRPSVENLVAEIRSTYPKSLSRLPTCVFREMDNATVRKKQSSTPIENFARLTYEFTVYASTKAKARDVYDTGDDALIAMGFTRLSSPFTDDANNTDVVRIVGRYECVIDREGVIYRVG